MPNTVELIVGRSACRRTRVLAFLGLGWLVLASPGTQAADSTWSRYPVGTSLAVTTHSGRVFRGELDAKSNADQLWLVARAEGMQVGSCIRTTDVLSYQEVARLELPPIHGGHVRRLPPARPVVAPHPPVKSLAIFARLENWDDDSEPDGLRLYLAPRGARGELVPATGSLSVQLAVSRGDWRPSRIRTRDEERWSREVSAAEFGPEGAVLDLPFHVLRPESDLDAHCIGTLRARWNVAGQGSFDAVQYEVELRARPTIPLF